MVLKLLQHFKGRYPLPASRCPRLLLRAAGGGFLPNVEIIPGQILSGLRVLRGSRLLCFLQHPRRLGSITKPEMCGDKWIPDFARMTAGWYFRPLCLSTCHTMYGRRFYGNSRLIQFSLLPEPDIAKSLIYYGRTSDSIPQGGSGELRTRVKRGWRQIGQVLTSF